MKKSKLSLGLVTSFIAAMSLTACNSLLTKDDGALVSFKGYDGETIEVITNDMYNQYVKTSDGVSKFYNQILEVLIRYEFKSGKMEGKAEKSYKQIEAEAKNSVQEQKDTAKKNAKNNGTKYEDEWEEILDAKGVEDEKELLENYIYDLEKSQIEDWYFKDEDNKAQLTKEFIGVDKDGNATTTDIDSAFPYHIRHILLKVEDGGSDYYNGTVSSAQAKKIATTVSKLADGKQSFGAIALTDSEDTSNTAYGDVGIMTTQLSGSSLQMVNEFQLGIYTYDAILNTQNTNETILKGLGVSGDYKDSAKSVKDYYLDEIGSKITEVPYSAIEELGEYAELETDLDNEKICDGNSILFPRNILWNKYLNRHQVFVISNATQNTTMAALPNEVGAYDTTSAKYALAEDGKCGFRAASEYGISTDANMRVLTDEAGRIILGVRSTYGIHLMVMQKSVFEYADGALEKYYTTEVPGSKNYPEGAETYVNYVATSAKADYTERAKTVKDKIKGFDATYDYRLYNYMIDGLDVQFNGSMGKDLGEAISDYIARQKENNLYNHEKGMNGVWETYFELLEAQEANRTSDRMVSEGCVIGFTEAGHEGLYEKGGACYYAK